MYTYVFFCKNYEMDLKIVGGCKIFVIFLQCLVKVS